MKQAFSLIFLGPALAFMACSPEASTGPESSISSGEALVSGCVERQKQWVRKTIGADPDSSAEAVRELTEQPAAWRSMPRCTAETDSGPMLSSVSRQLVFDNGVGPMHPVFGSFTIEGAPRLQSIGRKPGLHPSSSGAATDGEVLQVCIRFETTGDRRSWIGPSRVHWYSSLLRGGSVQSSLRLLHWDDLLRHYLYCEQTLIAGHPDFDVLTAHLVSANYVGLIDSTQIHGRAHSEAQASK